MRLALPQKSRTPAPPKRPVQSPKVRTAPRDERQSRMLLYGLAASGFLILGIVVAVFAFAGGSDNSAASAQNAIAALREAGFTYSNPRSQGREHVEALPASFKPNSTPRASGPHSNQTIIYGSYTESVPELNAVHNLEHGAVIIWYGPDVPQSTIDQINDFYNEDPNGLIVSMHPQLGDDVALVAWTHVARGARFDADAAERFVDRFGFRGPESCKNDLEQGCFRKDNLEPGQP
jgi:Protein of unknown function (DUF3105)